MANEEAVVEGEEGAEPAKQGGKKGLIIAIVALLVLGGGGAGAWFAFGGKHDPADKSAKTSKKEEGPKLPPRYVNIDPPFVVNFEAETVVRFLQVTIGVMTRDPAVELIIKENDPRVRNDLLMILANQTYATVSTVEGKEQLRQRCLDAVRHIVKEMGGEDKKLEALYFTAFVMQ